MQSITRVPPPGTGSYSVPNNYYNNAPATGAQTSTTPVGLSPTQMTAGGVAPSTVVPAQFSQPADPYAPDAMSMPPNVPGSLGGAPVPATNLSVPVQSVPPVVNQSFSDVAPNLNWQ